MLILLSFTVINIIYFTSGALLAYLLLYITNQFKTRRSLQKNSVVYSKELPHYKLVETIRLYLFRNGFPFAYNEENYYFEIPLYGFKDLPVQTVLVIYVRPDESHIKFQILICNKVSDGAVQRVVEFVSRMNDLPKLGHYIFNFEERFCLFTYNLHMIDQPLSDHIFTICIKNLASHYVMSAKAFDDVANNNHDPLLTYISLLQNMMDKAKS